MENIASQYDEIVQYLAEHYRFKKKLHSKALGSVSGQLKAFENFPRLWKSTNLLIYRRIDILKELYIKAASANDKEQSFFSILTSEYPIDALSNELERRLPHANFDRLLLLHTLKRKHLSRMRIGFGRVVSVILGAGVVFLQTVPEVVVTRLGIGYKEYQHLTFWIMVGAIIYLGLAFVPLEIRYAKAKSQNDLIGDVLEYTSIRLKKTSAEDPDLSEQVPAKE